MGAVKSEEKLLHKTNGVAEHSGGLSFVEAKINIFGFSVLGHKYGILNRKANSFFYT